MTTGWGPPSAPVPKPHVGYEGQIPEERLDCLRWFPRALTRAEVALVLGITRTRVLQIERAGLVKIRRQLCKNLGIDEADLPPL